MTGGSNDFETSGDFLSSSTIYFGYFSALNVNKRVLGGPLIWHSAKFTKQFSYLKPHY
jgi:hypothetical protein